MSTCKYSAHAQEGGRERERERERERKRVRESARASERASEEARGRDREEELIRHDVELLVYKEQAIFLGHVAEEIHAPVEVV